LKDKVELKKQDDKDMDDVLNYINVKEYEKYNSYL